MLPGRTLNRDLSDALGREVVKIEVVPVKSGASIRLVFEQARSPWRQGVWLATQGVLRVGDVESPQVVLWFDTAPPQIDVLVEATDGLLRFYNVWDSDRGKGEFESQSASSGMVLEDLGSRGVRYACTDIGSDPQFDKLVFRVELPHAETP